MPGILMRYAVEVGQRVVAGATTAVLEAMKMELTLPAPATGVVQQLCAGPGSKVPRGAHLLIIGPG
jgi:3-methylcrotonyl-CoA carboxylase alpha subunit